MSELVFPNVWGSVAKFSNTLIDEIRIDYPGVDLQFHDWDAHANFNELPNADLIGPTGVGLTEVSANLFEIVFAVGVSTYGSDENLFRQRDYISRVFEKLRPQKTVPFYSSVTAQPKSFIVMTDGTTVAPMSRADVRPWQFVQGLGLLEPSSV